MLLPLSDPFAAPTDRDMLPSERREFVRTHRTCVFGYGRRADGPAMSIVYYVPTEGDELLVSTMEHGRRPRPSPGTPRSVSASSTNVGRSRSSRCTPTPRSNVTSTS